MCEFIAYTIEKFSIQFSIDIDIYMLLFFFNLMASKRLHTHCKSSYTSAQDDFFLHWPLLLLLLLLLLGYTPLADRNVIMSE